MGQTYHSTSLGVQKTVCGIGSLSPPCGYQGLNSHRQTWWQAPLPELPLAPLLFFGMNDADGNKRGERAWMSVV